MPQVKDMRIVTCARTKQLYIRVPTSLPTDCRLIKVYLWEHENTPPYLDSKAAFCYVSDQGREWGRTTRRMIRTSTKGQYVTLGGSNGPRLYLPSVAEILEGVQAGTIPAIDYTEMIDRRIKGSY